MAATGMRRKRAPAAGGPLHEAAAQGHSLLHRLDPRAKLVVALAFTLVIAVGQDLLPAALGLGIGVLVVLLARLPLRLVLRRLAMVNVFVVFLWVFMPWRLEMNAGGLGLVHDPRGLFLAGLITVKVNGLFLALLGLLGTSRVNEILHALDHLRLPGKLVSLFLLFHRYIFVIYQEYRRLTRAMLARGFRPGTNLHTYRAYAHLVGMLLVRSFDRAERVYRAMLARGFEGTFWLLDHFHWQRRDTVFSVAAGVVVLGLVWVEWGMRPWS